MLVVTRPGHKGWRGEGTEIFKAFILGDETEPIEASCDTGIAQIGDHCCPTELTRMITK